MSEIKLNSVEEAIADFKEGKFVIVVDDEDRENEGDLIVAAEKITPEMVNFMLKHARGVLCVPITLSRCKELNLPHQVNDNTSVLGTPSGAHQPPLCPRQRRAEAQRTHRGGNRPVSNGRPVSRRCADGDNERRRNDGPIARIEGDGG